MNLPLLARIDAAARESTASPAFTVVPAHEPIVNAMNLGVTRGDGIFETVGIYRGIVQSEEEHLRRFARSARLLEMSAPNLSVYRDAVRSLVRLLPEQAADREFYCKYVMTRGIERGSLEPTGWAFMDVNPDWSVERTTGIRVMTLSRGYALDIADTSPWVLQGAKYLSYAVNRAAVRYAERNGADDVIFTSTDGYVFEGPTSSVLIRMDDVLLSTRPDQGVLLGTAQTSSFQFAAEAGFTHRYQAIPTEDLERMQNAWLLNSQRLAAPIKSLNGRPVPVDAELTAALNAHLLNRRC